MLLINPVNLDTHEYRDETKETIRKGFTYLHGQLQYENGYDIFGVVAPFDFRPGIYPCKVIGFEKEATFYLWNGTDLRLHGLVVFNDDLKEVEYAKKCYESKETCL